MTRSIPTALATAIDQPVVRPFFAIRIELPDPVYAWTGRGNLIFNDGDGISRTWQGVGGLGAIDTIGEASDGSATGLRAVLYEIPGEFRDNIKNQAERGALFEIYVGSLNETYQTIEAVHLLNKYKVDDYKITDGGDTLSVEIVGESRAIDQRRPAIKRFNDEYQQRKYPGDLFFQYLSQMTEISILWAAASQNSTGSSSGVGGVDGGGYLSRSTDGGNYL